MTGKPIGLERIPPILHSMVEQYAEMTATRLAGALDGFYIVGSIALDGFNERYSDIDFVAVVAHRLTDVELDTLASIHHTLARQFPQWKLSGIYLQAQDLGRSRQEVSPHPYYHDGKLVRAGQMELNTVTWWILKNHGIAIWGAEPQALPFTADTQQLVTETRENLNTYWRGWATRWDRRLVLLSDWGIQWAVLGVARQVYTLSEHSITTKMGGGQYVLTHLPERWHPLIQEAMNLRREITKSAYPTRFHRMQDAVKFIHYVIESNNSQ